MWPIHKVVVRKWSLCYPYSSPEGLFRVVHKWPPEKFTKSYKLGHATWPQEQQSAPPRSNGCDPCGTPAGTDRTRTSPTATDRESIPTTSWAPVSLIPLFKSGIKANPNNYRPISLLSHFDQIFEKILWKRLVAKCYIVTNVDFENCILQQWRWLRSQTISSVSLMKIIM